MADATPQPQPGTPTVAIGSLRLTGAAALIAVFVILVGGVALIVWMRPSPWMLASGLLWITFIAYWSAKAGGSAPGKEGESEASRHVHELMLNTAILLLFVPVCNLGGTGAEKFASPSITSSFAQGCTGSSGIRSTPR